MFVFSLNYILSNHMYILSNHMYILSNHIYKLSNRFFILSNRVNIGLKSMSNVFNTEQFFSSNFVLSQKFPFCTAGTHGLATTQHKPLSTYYLHSTAYYEIYKLDNWKFSLFCQILFLVQQFLWPCSAV